MGDRSTLRVVTADVQMPCPECIAAEHPDSRIGNRRALCATCNRFAQRVARHTQRRMREAAPSLYESLRAEVEREVYAMTVVRSTFGSG